MSDDRSGPQQPQVPAWLSRFIPLPPVPASGAPVGKHAAQLQKQYDNRLPRYCRLDYEQWLNEVRYHPVAPFGRSRVSGRGTLRMAAFLCLCMMIVMMSYSIAMVRFVLWGGVGLVPLVTSQLAYEPSFNTSDGNQYEFLSGQAQWNPFGYAEVINIRNSSASANDSNAKEFTQYAQSSDLGSDCTYSVVDVVTGFDEPTWATDRKYAPQGSSQRTLGVPACSALHTALICWPTLLAVLVVGGITTFGLLICGVNDSQQSMLLDELQVDLGNIPDSSSGRAPLADQHWFEGMPDTEPVPPPAPLPAEHEMREYVFSHPSAGRGSWRCMRPCRLVTTCVAVTLMDVFALATLIAMVSVVHDKGFVDAQAGTMLALALVSCCVPLVFATSLAVLELVAARRLADQQHKLEREHEPHIHGVHGGEAHFTRSSSSSSSLLSSPRLQF